MGPPVLAWAATLTVARLLTPKAMNTWGWRQVAQLKGPNHDPIGAFSRSATFVARRGLDMLIRVLPRLGQRSEMSG